MAQRMEATVRLGGMKPPGRIDALVEELVDPRITAVLDAWVEDDAGDSATVKVEMAYAYTPGDAAVRAALVVRRLLSERRIKVERFGVWSSG